MPTADIHGQRRAYRRGVVLGLTMAEIMTLVIFALLLVLTALTLSRQHQITVLQKRVAELSEQLAAAVPPGMDRQKIEDIFRELALAKRDSAALKVMQQRVAELEERAKQYQRIKTALADIGDLNDKDTAERVAERLTLAKQVIDVAEKAGMPAADPMSISQMMDRAKDADATAANLRGQIANLQKALKAAGKGADFPPCWADEVTGKPEYIFDVSITSSGIVVRDNALPHRAADQKKLPIGDLEFGRTLSNAAFLEKTRDLFEWSKHQDPACRFFVRLYDLTKDTEKTTFKNGLRTVEGHFYKLLSDDMAGAPR